MELLQIGLIGFASLMIGFITEELIIFFK